MNRYGNNTFLAVSLIGLLAASFAEAADERLSGAQEFFDRYQQLERSFDPELASL